MKRFIFISIVLGLLIWATVVMAGGFAVVVHPGNTSVTKQQAVNIFLLKSKAFPNGRKAVPILPPEGSSAYAALARAIGKDGAQLKAYYMKQVLTGKANKPQEAPGKITKATVASNPIAIGVIGVGAVDSSVRVVFTF